MSQTEPPTVPSFDYYVAAAVRQAQGVESVSTAELARRSGIPERTLIRYRKAEREIRMSSLFVLAAALNTTPDAIMRQARRLATEKTGLTWEEYTDAVWRALDARPVLDGREN